MKTQLAIVAVLCAYPIFAEAQSPAKTSVAVESRDGNHFAGSTSSPKVLKFLKLPLVLDEPGDYVLDRNWVLPFSNEGPSIEIRADHVVLDLEGFRIQADAVGPAILITGLGVHLRNGEISGQADSTIAIHSTGHATEFDNLTVYSGDRGIVLDGFNPHVTRSFIGGITGLHMSAPGAIVERSTIGCRSRCLVTGEQGQVLFNRISASEGNAVRLGAGNTFSSNVIEVGEGEGSGIAVIGNGTVVLDNSLRLEQAPIRQSIAIVVDGSRNVLRGNIALAGWDEPQNRGPWAVGISFMKDGNVYVGNQMEALVPFDLGATVQTDLGGNVGF